MEKRLAPTAVTLPEGASGAAKATPTATDEQDPSARAQLTMQLDADRYRKLRTLRHTLHREQRDLLLEALDKLFDEYQQLLDE